MPIFAIVRNERYVIPVTRYECDRRFLSRRFRDRSERAVAIDVGRSALNRNAVFAQKIDNHIRQRRPFFDRHEKNIVAAVSVFLRQDPGVGDEDET